MQGYTHALSGAAAWFAVTSAPVVNLGLPQYSEEVILGGAVVCAGAALLADADHAHGTIAYSLRPVTPILTRIVHRLSGGHRHGTHSLIGIAVFGALAYLASLWTINVDGKTVAIGAGLVAALCVAFASKSLGLTKGLGLGGIAGDIISSPLGEWIVAFGVAGAITWWLDYKWTWLAPCVVVGCFAHIIGDMLTPEGVPWLWPWNPKPPKALRHPLRWFWGMNGYFRVPLLGHVTRRTGSFQFTRESFLGILIAAYVIFMTFTVIMNLAGHNLHTLG